MLYGMQSLRQPHGFLGEDLYGWIQVVYGWALSSRRPEARKAFWSGRVAKQGKRKGKRGNGCKHEVGYGHPGKIYMCSRHRRAAKLEKCAPAP